jgi:hypothetical protein
LLLDAACDTHALITSDGGRWCGIRSTTDESGRAARLGLRGGCGLVSHSTPHPRGGSRASAPTRRPVDAQWMPQRVVLGSRSNSRSGPTNSGGLVLLLDRAVALSTQRFGKQAGPWLGLVLLPASRGLRRC